ncbi:PP2C family protein-serine/threonine phosphatase [Streptomyces niveus]|uniref:PP2C family protein-serine/threonine phosphatase n=1 Tax=Streptomyces niveus TaxID=193462 RepID=UPI003413C23F
MALTATGDWTIGVVCDGVSMSPRAERAAQVATTVGAAHLEAGLLAGVLPETALEDAAAHAGRAVSALAASVDAAPACTYVAGIAGPEGIWCAWTRSYRPQGPGRLLLCTDGLTRHLSDADALRAVLARVRRPTPPGHGPLDDARALIGYALGAGGQDNITALLIHTDRPRRGY